MTLDKLEAQAKADKTNENEVRFGTLLVIWDEMFEYYECPRPGVYNPLERDEAIDLLNDIAFKQGKR